MCVVEVFNDNYKKCVGCGKPFEASEMVEDGYGGLYCKECIKNLIKCQHCKKFHYPEDFEAFNGDMYCPVCWEELIHSCDNCGTVCFRDDLLTAPDDSLICQCCYGSTVIDCANCTNGCMRNDSWYTRDGLVCERCYSDHYFECEECGDNVHEDEGYDGVCNSCSESGDNDSHGVHSHSYKPTPIFLKKEGDDDLFLGVELEVDEGGDDVPSSVAEIDMPVYFKGDGSISNGFEIVSHPCTLNYHLGIRWKDMLHTLVKEGYTSHNAGTCGIHVHIPKAFLGATEEEQDKYSSRIMSFYELNWEHIVKFSRRKPDQLRQWAARFRDDITIDLVKKAKCGTFGRYRAVNLEPKNTVEFRIFRGTLKYSTFISCLQFVDASVRFCMQSDDLQWETFQKFVQYEELKERIG